VRESAPAAYQLADGDEAVLTIEIQDATPLTDEEFSPTVAFDTAVPVESFGKRA
jgi:hypothetical protein